MRKVDKAALDKYRDKIRMLKEGGRINPDETDSQQAMRIARAKIDYTYFAETYLYSLATDKTPDFHVRFANRVAKNKKIKAGVRWGRSLAKSVVCDVGIPLWLWMKGEPVYVVLVGQTEKKAQQLLSDVQAILEAEPQLIHDFGEQKIQGFWADGFFQSKGGFIGQAIGAGQSVRGLRVGKQRPTLCIVDDLDDRQTIKNEKRQRELATWIERALIPTMDGEYERFLMPNNYFHPITVQDILIKKHPKWHLDQVNAYDPVTYEPTWKDKYTADYYREKEEDDALGTRAEYNNDPHIEGEVFKPEMIQWASRPRMDSFTTIAAHWDVAYSGSSTGDFNSIRVMGLHGNNFWHLKAFTRRCKMVDAIRWMFDFEDDLNKKREKKIIIHWRFESQFWNDALIMVLRQVEKEKGRSLNLVKTDRPTSKKYDRIICLHPFYQNGKIYYSDSEKGSVDMQVSLAQLYGIEPGYKSNDDAPDAEAGCVEYLSRFNRSSEFKPRLGPPRQRHSFY